MDSCWTDLQNARERNDRTWDEYKQTLSRNNSRIDSLKAEADRAHRNMCEAFDNASRAYNDHDGASAKSFADDGHEYQDERDRLNAEVRELIEENKSARSSAGAYDYEVQCAREAHSRARDRYKTAQQEFHRLKDRQDQAKHEKERTARIFQDTKNSFLQAKDDLNAFKAKQHEDKLVRQNQKEALAEKAGIPRQYWNDLIVKTDRNGSVNIYFGGSGSSDGSGHGHVSLDRSGRTTYTRMPFQPHGAQNYANYVDPDDSNPQHSGGGHAPTWENPRVGTIDGHEVTFWSGTGKRQGETILADGFHIGSVDDIRSTLRGQHNHAHYGKGGGYNCNERNSGAYTGPGSSYCEKSHDSATEQNKAEESSHTRVDQIYREVLRELGID